MTPSTFLIKIDSKRENMELSPMFKENIIKKRFEESK